jgi:hypothetical protein
MSWWNRKPDPFLARLDIILESQERTQLAFIQAVKAMADASSKQAEVLTQYLKLFQTPGEPQVWRANPEKENEVELLAAGFPKDGTEAEQAEWALQHLDIL